MDGTPIAQSAPEVVGFAEHYAQFVQLCRARAAALGITFGSLDVICGFPESYTAKLMCGDRAMSVYSFFTLARALALLPAFHDDQTQLAQLRSRDDWIPFRRNGAHYRGKRNGGVTRFQNHVDFYRQIGRKGAIAMHAKRRRRKASARHAALARWGNGYEDGPRK